MFKNNKKNTLSHDKVFFCKANIAGHSLRLMQRKNQQYYYEEMLIHGLISTFYFLQTNKSKARCYHYKGKE